MSAEEILGSTGALAKVFKGYEARPSQVAMARAVEDCLHRGVPLLVEAGTGTGKSLAYLVPAVQSGLRVVISTATKALGEQLLERDLPTLRKVGLEPEVAMVKGLGNYLCRRRVEDYRREVVSGAVRADPYLPAVLDWMEDSEEGDRAELSTVPDDAGVWREVTSSSDTRVGAKCRHYESCFVTRMRRRAEAARIIVTNHHMFCADLALRGAAGAQALPDYDVVIFDEAHALEDVATEFFGVRLTRTRVETLLRDALRAFEQAGLFIDPERRASLTRMLAGIHATAGALFEALPRGASSPSVARSLFSKPVSPQGGNSRMLLKTGDLDGVLGTQLSTLQAGIQGMHGLVADWSGPSEALVSVVRRTEALRDALAMMLELGRGTHVPWCDADARGGGAMGASPVHVGEILQEKLWSRTGAVVLTSATMSTSGPAPFEYLRRSLGVPEEAHELQLPSPFDYGSQCALYIPRGVPDPRDANYFDAAAEEIDRLVQLTEGGAFVLCTSVRQMRAFHEVLAERWEYPTWVQGMAPKQFLLSRFRASGMGVLFATSSFWEGVDVPGRALRLVIIDKLPFEVPSDPVVAARMHAITQAGGSPFEDFQLPSAALALKQGFGRLVRTRKDVGVVAILDRRLRTRGYGQSLLDALPPASRCNSFEELRAFWRSLPQDDGTLAAEE